MTESFLSYLKKLLIWESDKTETINEKINLNYIGGKNVRIKKLNEIFTTDNKTIDKINLSTKKFMLFILTVLLPTSLNTSAIILRWIERPKRDSTEFHNWSTLALIYVEAAVLVVYISVLVINVFSIYTNNFVAKHILTREINDKQKKIKNKLLKWSPKFFFILSVPFDIWLIVKFIIIFVEEYKFFFDSDPLIYTNTTVNTLTNTTTNETINIISNHTVLKESNFGELDLTLYINLLLFYTFIGISFAISRLKNFNHNYKKKEEGEGEGATTINYYDPRLTENIVDCLTFLNGFSLIKIISWIRHESMDHITAMIHKYKTNGDITKMKEEIGSCMFYYMLTIQLVVSISVYGFFYLIFIYLGFFGFIHRIKGVSFVGYVEPSQWNQIQLIEFCAFLNNILSLDTGKKRTFQSILNFLFTGEDAMEDDGEKYSQDSFKRLLISYSISKQGLIKTILVFTQLTHNDIQRICVIENYNTLDINDNNDNNDNNDIEEPTENDGEEIDDNDISIEGLIDMQNISKNIKNVCTVTTHKIEELTDRNHTHNP